MARVTERLNGRDAQAKGVSELLKREPWLEGPLQGDDHVLRAELHVAIVHSIFQNLESLESTALVGGGRSHRACLGRMNSGWAMSDRGLPQGLIGTCHRHWQA